MIADANAHFGYASALVIDESAFAKKGGMSAGVARQWNGRLGKTDLPTPDRIIRHAAGTLGILESALNKMAGRLPVG